MGNNVSDIVKGEVEHETNEKHCTRCFCTNSTILILTGLRRIPSMIASVMWPPSRTEGKEIDQSQIHIYQNAKCQRKAPAVFGLKDLVIQTHDSRLAR